MEGFKKYFRKSVFFNRLFAFNFVLLGLVFIPGIVRIWTGMERDKPVSIILFITIGYVLAAFFYLIRLKSFIGLWTIPKYYHTRIEENQVNNNSWEWAYYLGGSAVFVAGFTQLLRHGSNQGSTDGGWSGSDSGNADSGSSGCGNSCGGSSCGGCGGGSD